MITVNSISIHFSGNYLFDNVSFVVGDRDRIGLVGKNGAGKSTLLKIIAGQQECEKGNIVISKYQTIGYLPQEMIPSSTMSVIDEALTAFKGPLRFLASSRLASLPTFSRSSSSSA